MVLSLSLNCAVVVGGSQTMVAGHPVFQQGGLGRRWDGVLTVAS